MQIVAIFVIAMALAANAMAMGSTGLSPALRAAVLVAVAFNIHMRLHPESLSGGAPLKPGASPASLLWPGTLVWQWLGAITALHAVYAVARDASPIAARALSRKEGLPQPTEMLALAGATLVIYLGAGYAISFSKRPRRPEGGTQTPGQ